MFRFEMGPRARRNMRKGFHPAMLIPLLPFLFLGGWCLLVAAAARFGAGIMTVGAVFGVFGRLIGRLFSHAVTSSSVAVGTVIGLIWYFSRKNRNTSSRNDDDDEEEYFETRHYNSYGA